MVVGAGTAGAGTDGPGVRAVRGAVVVVAEPAVDAKDCRREAHGSPEARACFEIGGWGLGMAGHLPLVRTDR